MMPNKESKLTRSLCDFIIIKDRAKSVKTEVTLLKLCLCPDMVQTSDDDSSQKNLLSSLNLTCEGFHFCSDG